MSSQGNQREWDKFQRVRNWFGANMRLLFPIILLAGVRSPCQAVAQVSQSGDGNRGKIFFQQSCAIRLAATLDK
jgi:hypothetical protein